jgi:hypothetical protein
LIVGCDRMIEFTPSRLSHCDLAMSRSEPTLANALSKKSHADTSYTSSVWVDT